MAHYLHQVAGAAALETLWFNLLDSPRRALCELAHIDPNIGTQYNWKLIPVEYRVRLIRAMKALSEISVDCAVALEIARNTLEASDASH
jgi:hypothetical protein